MENGNSAGDFKAGSVVQLLSGGPEMTIRVVDKQKGDREIQCFCEWFQGKSPPYGELKETMFLSTSLKLIL